MRTQSVQASTFYPVETPSIFQLMNYRSDRDLKLEIYLEKICIASRHFQVRQLQGQIDPDSLIPNVGNGPGLSSLQIGWQERVTLHYLVIPLEKSNLLFTLST